MQLHTFNEPDHAPNAEPHVGFDAGDAGNFIDDHWLALVFLGLIAWKMHDKPGVQRARQRVQGSQRYQKFRKDYL